MVGDNFMDLRGTVKWSIKWKLMAIMAILIVILVAVLSYYQISSQRKILANELDNRISLMKDNLIERDRDERIARHIAAIGPAVIEVDGHAGRGTRITRRIATGAAVQHILRMSE